MDNLNGVSLDSRNSKDWPPEFVLHQPVALEEDGSTEFKEVNSENPARTITDTAEDYSVGFLNATGGRILWGIRDKDRCVTGVRIDSHARDRIRTGIASKLHTLQPQPDPTIFELKFHPVEGGTADLYVVELLVKSSTSVPHPFYNHRGELFVRTNGVNQKIQGQGLTAWIKQRIKPRPHDGSSVGDLKLLALAGRVRQVFDKHGLEPSHIPRFFRLRRAPFSVSLTDLQTDAALLHWLDESKIEWIAKTLLIRREWLDGEDARIHEEFCFDKKPQEFFSTIAEHVDNLVFDEVHSFPEVYFLRWGVGKDWQRKGESRVFVVISIPLARFSNDRIIYKYISDLQPYPWADHFGINIQLRAWARLLFLNKGFYCFGKEIGYGVGEEIYSNGIFLREVIENHCIRTSDDWHPEDYALFPEESRVAKDTNSLSYVIDYLRLNSLPCEKTRLFTGMGASKAHPAQ